MKNFEILILKVFMGGWDKLNKLVDYICFSNK